MTEKPNPPAEHFLYVMINLMMDNCEPSNLKRIIFETKYAKEGYEIDWNKRLDENGEWKNKELKE